MNIGFDRIGGLSMVSLLIVVFVVGCGESNELSRKSATVLLDNSETFRAPQDSAKTMGDAYAAMQNQGLLSKPNLVVDYSFEEAGILEVTKDEIRTSEAFYLEVKEVTGIAEVPMGDGNIKSVEFIWRRIDVPSVVRRFVYGSGTGKGVFRLYDDGWRIVELALEDPNIPFDLSEKEIAARDRDVEVTSQRLKMAEEELRKSREALAKKLQEYSGQVARSKTVKKTIGRYHYDTFEMRRKTEGGIVTLTDVGFEVQGRKYFFFDLFKPSNPNYRYNTSQSKGRITISSGTYANAAWGWRVYIVTIAPLDPVGGSRYNLFENQYDTPLKFSQTDAGQREFTRFKNDLSKSLLNWYSVNGALVQKPGQLAIDGVNLIKP